MRLNELRVPCATTRCFHLALVQLDDGHTSKESTAAVTTEPIFLIRDVHDDPLGSWGCMSHPAAFLPQKTSFAGTGRARSPHAKDCEMRTYTTLDDPLALFGTGTTGINDNGQIVGSYLDSAGFFQGFLYGNGTYTNGPLDTVAASINNNGQIVGAYLDSSGVPHGGLYSNGFYTFDDPLATNGTIPLGINNNGQIVGAYFDNVGSGEHGFLSTLGIYTTLDDPRGTFGTVAEGINDHGKIVGYFVNSNHIDRGFLYSNGTYTTLNDPLGTFGTEAWGINNNSQIVGIYYDSNHVGHGFHT
jgi:probable HAF family extracellular repeat protein